MFESFFHQLLLRNKAINEKWIQILEHQKDITNSEIKGLSRILNSHHIWNCKLQNQQAESQINDILPLDFLKKLNTSNHLETIEIIENNEIENVDLYFFIQEYLADQAFYRGMFYEVCQQKHLFDAALIRL
jgi:hypothetical protein